VGLGEVICDDVVGLLDRDKEEEEELR